MAYVVAVLHRTSLGVAGLAATERFGISAAVLATFAVVQLAVYAGAQVPVGVLLDRLGPRRMIAGGALLMALGQLLLGVVDQVPLALAARVLIGAGDAMTFVSVLRLVPSWFAPQRVPLVSQVTGQVGQLGQVLSAVPLVLLLQAHGWTTSFASLAAVGALAALLALLAVRDRPGPPPGRQPRGTSRANLRDAAREPGTWLGFWTHFFTMFSGTVFVMLWGYPFLVAGQGLAPRAASALLTLFVVSGTAFGPLLGHTVGRHPQRRTTIALWIGVATAVAWLVVLVPPGPRPFWVLALFVAVLGTGGPGSMIGFDFARTYNASRRLGTASGIVNVGGFTATLSSILAVGVVLDLVAPDGDYTGADFRLAFAPLAVPWLVGFVAIVVMSRRAGAAPPRTVEAPRAPAPPDPAPGD